MTVSGKWLFIIVTAVLLQNMYAQTDTIPPTLPQNIVIYGNEKHIDIDWWDSEESDVAGYKIYKEENGQYIPYSIVPRQNTYFSVNVGTAGTTLSFKLSAYDATGNESELSSALTATTGSMTDDEFLDMVQRATFRYFWDYGHPVSGLSRERLNSNETVTSGGSGFGIAAILTGIQRSLISRHQAAARIYKISNFLLHKADRFHGVYPHWLNGTTGKVIPFSQYDNGGDLVETAFLLQGLLTARAYFDGQDTTEIRIREMITTIWEETEWDWYRRSPYSNVLYWHWSPNYGWQMNFKITGYNEAMIIYILAVASPTHPVPARLFRDGWAGSGYTNPNSYYGNRLWVGQPYGGPLFFAHYSFMGFDPRGIKDAYCNYFNNNRSHTLINRAYCIANPYNHPGYNENSWGLTASDEPNGYSAHAPYSNDNGTITPTAALSSMPYTPVESIEALKYFYRTYFFQLWGEYGFKDAFNIRQNWFASSYIAIDQGPIMVMIENHRSAMPWNKFMSNPEIQPMLDSLGFVPDTVTSIDDPVLPEGLQLNGNFPNPFNPSTTVSFTVTKPSGVLFSVYNAIGEKVYSELFESLSPGTHEISWHARSERGTAVESGVYFYTLTNGYGSLSGKMVLLK